MKSIKRFAAFLVFCCVQSFANGQKTYINESFDSTQLIQQTNWNCDVSKFQIIGEQLASNSTVLNDVFGLSAAIGKRKIAEWSIDIHLPFATSSSNYVDFYLWSDSSCVAASTNSCFVRIGGTKDRIELIKKEHRDTTSILVSQSGLTHSLSGTLRCVLDSLSTLHVSFYDSIGGMYLWQDSVERFQIDSAGFMGVSIRQSTASFHLKHRFDNWYYGAIRTDTIPPQLVEFSVLSDSILVLIFNEEIDSTALAKSNVKLLPTGKIPSYLYVSKDTVFLIFPKRFQTQRYELVVDSINDMFGRTAEQLRIIFNYVAVEEGALHDVLLSEIMSDHSPSVGLPPSEYVELTNRSKKIIDLNGWILTDKKKQSVLRKYYLWPDSSVLLIDQSSQKQYEFVTNLLPVTGLVSLNNASDSLMLMTAENKLIHEVNYSIDWHQNEWKKEGGWSLEMMDIDQPCAGSKNWTSSISEKGGTPGLKNSVQQKLEDHVPPTLIDIEVSDMKVVLTWDESLRYYQPSVNHFSVQQNSILDVKKIDEYHLEIALLQKIERGKSDVLYIEGVTDCNGNVVKSQEHLIAIGGKLEEGSLVINEMLYDVAEQCAEFIEIFNPTEVTYNLKDLYVGYRDPSGEWLNLNKVTSANVLIHPHEYKAITSDTNDLKQCKPVAINMIYSEKLPAFVNGGGIIGLSDVLGNVIDTFQYHDDLHFPLLSDTKDVSLERLNPYLPSSTWTSAAQSFNYATAGSANSQLQKVARNNVNFAIQTDPVSPNQDGYNDRLIVEYSPLDDNTLVHLRIFDQVGRLVAFPINSSLSGIVNQYVWDCLTTEGEIVPAGIYVLQLEWISLNGSHGMHKLSFTVTR